MRLYERILRLFPLASYEEERSRNGCMTFVREEEAARPADGLTYSKRLYLRGNGAPVWVYIVTLSPDASAHWAVSAAPAGTILQVREHARRFEGSVLFAMNASFFHFFNNGDLTPYGIQIVRGKVCALPRIHDKPQHSSNFFAVTKEGLPLIADMDDYSEHLEGRLQYAVGGGLRLMIAGKIHLHSDESVAPRTAIGIAKDGTVIALCADGRSRISAGLSYADLIDIYTHLGFEILELLNLDGGGSTAALLREENGSFRMLNVPSGPPTPTARAVEPHGEEQARPVADALLIVADSLYDAECRFDSNRLTAIPF